jgi:hypothetical protein
MNINRVNTYREKHSRCKTCIHASTGSYLWFCKAKNTLHKGDLRKTKIKGVLCEIYLPKNFD